MLIKYKEKLVNFRAVGSSFSLWRGRTEEGYAYSVTSSKSDYCFYWNEDIAKALRSELYSVLLHREAIKLGHNVMYYLTTNYNDETASDFEKLGAISNKLDKIMDNLTERLKLKGVIYE